MIIIVTIINSIVDNHNHKNDNNNNNDNSNSSNNNNNNNNNNSCKSLAGRVASYVHLEGARSGFDPKEFEIYSFATRRRGVNCVYLSTGRFWHRH